MIFAYLFTLDVFFVYYFGIEHFPSTETTVPLPLPQEKYLMHMPESILILHQLKVAHEALNGDREQRTFFWWHFVLKHFRYLK